MNKCFLMTAAALAAASAAASTDAYATSDKSASATIAFLTTNGGTYCDTMTISWKASLAYGSHDFQTGCGFGGTSGLLGREGKVKGEGKVFVLGDNFYAVYYGQNWSLSYDISAPIRGQGTVTSCLSDGEGVPQCSTGAYIVVDNTTARPSVVHRSTVKVLSARKR